MGIYNKVYVNKRKKVSKRTILIILTIFILLNTFLYIFDKNVLPAVMQLAEIKMKNEATDIIYSTCMDVSKEDVYTGMASIQKDEQGKVSSVETDTAKLNKLTSTVVTECNKKLKELNDLGVSVPLGFMTSNSVIHKFGPDVTIKMSQVGNISTSYDSVFESAGINQTRHKIYLNVKVTMRVVVPLNSKDVDIECQIPISDIVIVGETPQTSIDFNGNK
ncbi:MAG: sporulation protein YunB [Clostridium sp.]